MIVHCWEDRTKEPIGPCSKCEAGEPGGHNCWLGVAFSPSATCMLEQGHEGAHRFTDDSKIGVAFV